MEDLQGSDDTAEGSATHGCRGSTGEVVDIHGST